MKAIGADIGTTTMSFVVMDLEKGEVIEARTVSNRSFIKTRETWKRIQDVEVIIAGAVQTIDELLDHHPEVDSIGITGQMHGILYLDCAGKCVSPLYTWQDQRGTLPEIDGGSAAELIRDTCGEDVPAGYGLVTHLYHHRKGMVPETAVSLCTIPDYLGMVLTGLKAPLMHSSMAASLGLFDAPGGRFMSTEIERLGMDPCILPRVTGSMEILGTYRGRSVTVALGDNQASFLGSVGLRANTLLVNMGTGGQISILSDQHFKAPGIEARPFLEGKFLLVGASLCGGRAYAILEKFFRSYVAAAGGEAVSQYEVMEKLALQGQAEDGMEVITTFNGTRLDPASRGSIHNLSEDNFTPQGMILGVLTGIARELYDMYTVISRGTEIHLEAVVASGNGLRKNKVLQQIVREMFQAELTLAECEEEAACGAAVSSVI